jgi:hypothetical protein
MTDKREMILSRLFTVLQGVPGVATDPETGGPCVYRNRDELPDNKRPGILLLDANEVAEEKAKDRNRLSKSPDLVMIKPEIYVTLTTAKPQNEGQGEALSAMRSAVLKAVLLDDTLNDLCGVGKGGEMQYAGSLTDMARGQPMEGEIGIMISFTYIFKPTEL